MKMIEALEWAADYAQRSQLFVAPLNNRGYVKDGWADPTPEAKTAVILKIATEVCDEKPGQFSGDDVISTVENLWNEHAVYHGMYDTDRPGVHINFLLEIKERFGGR